MLPDRDLDDLLAVMVIRLEQAESRIIELERQEKPGGTGVDISMQLEDGFQLLLENGDILLCE